jgi:hypothetical protein
MVMRANAREPSLSREQAERGVRTLARATPADEASRTGRSFVGGRSPGRLTSLSAVPSRLGTRRRADERRDRLGLVLSGLERSTSTTAVAAVICLAGLGRAALEVLVAGHPSRHTLLSILTSVSFYAESAVLFAAVFRLAAGLSWSRSLAIASLGTCVGLVPPIADTLSGGQRSGYYTYFHLPTEEWAWSLFDSRVATGGESWTLWGVVAGVTLITLAVTRSAFRCVAAAILAYAAVALLALLPPLTWRWLEGSVRVTCPSVATCREFSATLTQVCLALVLALALRGRLLLRLGARLLHALPFVALVWLGAAVQGRALGEPGRFLNQWPHVAIASLLLLLTTVATILGNDLLDVWHGTRRGVTRRDYGFAVFLVGIAVLGSTMLDERVGLLLALCLLLGIMYNSRDLDIKRTLVANALVEGGWGLCAFLLGRSIPGQRHELTSFELVCALLAFSGWVLFNALKDYKDVLFDARTGNRTIYTLALERGWHLRTVHRTLCLALAVSVTVELVVVASLGLGVAWAAAGVSALGLCWSMLGVRRSRALPVFLILLTLHIASLCFVVG